MQEVAVVPIRAFAILGGQGPAGLASCCWIFRRTARFSCTLKPSSLEPHANVVCPSFPILAMFLTCRGKAQERNSNNRHAHPDSQNPKRFCSWAFQGLGLFGIVVLLGLPTGTKT